MNVRPWLNKLQPSLSEVSGSEEGRAEAARIHGLTCQCCGAADWHLSTVREPVHQLTNFAAVAECAKCGRTLGIFNANDFGADFPLHAGRVLKCTCSSSTFHPILTLLPDSDIPTDQDRASHFQLLARCASCATDLNVIDWEFEAKEN